MLNLNKFYIIVFFYLIGIHVNLYSQEKKTQKKDTFQFVQDSVSFESVIELRITKAENKTVLNFSGDKQYEAVKKELTNPIRVLVTDAKNNPVPNHPVYFELVFQPAKSEGFFLHDTVAYTNNLGIASTKITLGSKPGDYDVNAKIRGDYTQNTVFFKLHARKSNWVFLLSIGLIGGLGLFLFGMNLMSEGMQRSAGDKMRSILSNLTKNRFVAVGVGAFVTMVIQSSSATTVMLVSFVQSGLLQFAQTLGIILGADIGTTITAQMIAFKLTDYSLLMVGLGFGVTMFSKKQKLKYIGETILGFGILFFGMDIMSKAMYPLRSYQPFIELLLELENPLLGLLIGTAFTALVQSSSAFVGIIIVLATQGLITLEAGIPLLFGANLGTAITAILASINAGREAKKVALAHTLFKVVGVILFIWWIPTFVDIVISISPKGDIGADTLENTISVLPRQIANAHTIFNVALTVIALPFIRLFAKLIQFILPERKEDVNQLKLKYLDQDNVPTPALALNLAKNEVIRMANAVQDMVNDMILPFFVKQDHVIEELELKEKQIDFLRDEINSYLLKISRNEIDEQRMQEAFQILYTIIEFEQMSDVIVKNLVPKARKWVSSKADFSEDGKKELIDYQQKTQLQIQHAIEVFRDVNLKKAAIMKKKYKKYRTLSIEYEKQHFKRVKNKVEESVKSSKMHLELLEIFKVLTHHATNVARILLEWTPEKKSKKKKKSSRKKK